MHVFVDAMSIKMTEKFSPAKNIDKLHISLPSIPLKFVKLRAKSGKESKRARSGT